MAAASLVVVAAEAEAAAGSHLAACTQDGYTGEYKEVHAMANAYEFEGELYGSVGDFLNALAHEYKTGDREAVVDALEEYGFTLSDLNVRPN